MVVAQRSFVHILQRRACRSALRVILLGELSGVGRPVRHLPFAAGKIAGAVELACAELFGRAPRLTPGVVEIFKHDWVYSSMKATRELGYHVTQLEEGLRKTIASLSH